VSLEIKCDCCGKDISDPGALLFGPPKDKQVSKTHICVTCYEILKELLKTIPRRG